MSAPGLPSLDEVVDRLGAVRDRIRRAGGDPGCVEVLGVTKGLPPEIVAVALGAGLRSLGENYAQELQSKVAWCDAHRVELVAEPAWHFIGHLQRNKVRQIADAVRCFQSVDRPELADEVAKRRPGASVLIQVNTTGEASKSGCAPGDAEALVERARGLGLAVDGLMTVGPTDVDADPTPAFRQLRRLVDAMGLQVASMGMTGDLEAAVAEGSTMVRIGTALFGPRPPRS